MANPGGTGNTMPARSSLDRLRLPETSKTIVKTCYSILVPRYLFWMSPLLVRYSAKLTRVNDRSALESKIPYIMRNAALAVR